MFLPLRLKPPPPSINLLLFLFFFSPPTPLLSHAGCRTGSVRLRCNAALWWLGQLRADNDRMKWDSLTQPFLAWTTRWSTPACAVVIWRRPWLPWLHSGSFQPVRPGGSKCKSTGFKTEIPEITHARESLLLNAPEPVINFIAWRLTPLRFKGINYPASLVTSERLQCDNTKGMSRDVEWRWNMGVDGV